MSDRGRALREHGKLMRRLAVCLAALATVFAVQFDAASAGIARDLDRKNDVKRYDWHDGGSFVGKWYTDTKSVHVRHTSNAVIITTRFWKLSKGPSWGPGRAFDAVFNSIRTDDEKFVFVKDLQDRSRTGVHTWQDHEFRCTARTTIKYRDNLVRTRIPRSCLGGPRWVNVDSSFLLTWPTYPDIPGCCTNSARDDTGFTGRARRG